MTLNELKQEYRTIEGNGSYAEFFKFSRKLNSSNEEGFLNYHLQIIGETENQKLMQVLANSFVKRGIDAEKYLLYKINQEQDNRIKGIILQMLGKMGCAESIPYALNFVKGTDANLQYRGIIVLGWVGTSNEIRSLEELLFSHDSPEIRGYAATAMRQIWFRLPKVQRQVSTSLQKALLHETNEETLSSVIIVLQDIFKRKFGLNEDIDEGKITGDVSQAKDKASKFLEAL